jgi:L,D-transpeptidase ErfK/SrfK
MTHGGGTCLRRLVEAAALDAATLAIALAAGAGFFFGPSVAYGSGDTAQSVSGGVRTYVVVRGDTVSSIAARFGVDPAVIVKDNRLPRADALQVGQSLVLDTRHIVPSVVTSGVVVVNVPQRMLWHSEAGAVTAAPVAVGRATWATPLGDFTVVAKEVDPTWEVPASILEEARRAGRTIPPVVPPGPQNPLGRHWIGLSRGGIGIHGTNAPSSIYQAVTHGCIRVHPDDIALLFPRVATGAGVRIVYEPVLLATDGSRVFLEVHPDVYRRAPAVLAETRRLVEAAGVRHRVDWGRLENVVAERGGVARDITAERSPD